MRICHGADAVDASRPVRCPVFVLVVLVVLVVPVSVGLAGPSQAENRYDRNPYGTTTPYRAVESQNRLKMYDMGRQED